MSSEEPICVIIAIISRSRLMGDIYMNLHGVGQAVDVIVVTPEEVQRYRNTHCLGIAPAVREDKEVYHA